MLGSLGPAGLSLIRGSSLLLAICGRRRLLLRTLLPLHCFLQLINLLRFFWMTGFYVVQCFVKLLTSLRVIGVAEVTRQVIPRFRAFIFRQVLEEYRNIAAKLIGVDVLLLGEFREVDDILCVESGVLFKSLEADLRQLRVGNRLNRLRSQSQQLGLVLRPTQRLAEQRTAPEPWRLGRC